MSLITAPVVYQEGNTVRLLASFYDWEGNRVAPPVVRLKVYDHTFTQLSNDIVETVNAAGQYYYDLIAQVGDFYYEWYTEIEGKPSLLRTKLTVRKA